MSKKTKKADPRLDVLADLDMPEPGEARQFERDCRIAGTLVGAAVADALGVPYEGSHRGPKPGTAKMTGGGFGGYKPGQYSEDVSRAYDRDVAV